MEFKGWVTDYSKSSLQEITDGEITILLNRSRETGAEVRPKWVGSDQTLNEQGTVAKGNYGWHVAQA